jgi:hypothetical protein
LAKSFAFGKGVNRDGSNIILQADGRGRGVDAQPLIVLVFGECRMCLLENFARGIGIAAVSGI